MVSEARYPSSIRASLGKSAVRSVLNAAALTYVAGALQSVMPLLYYVMTFRGSGSRRRES